MRGRRLLVVEDSFAISGRGLVLAPEVDLRDAHALVVSIRRPDRRVIRALAFVDVTIAEGRARHLLRVERSKDDVPHESEVWLLDPIFDGTGRGARDAWQRGDWLLCGTLLDRSLRDHERPAWAAGVLEAACRFADAPERVRAVLEIAGRPARWKEAHDAFSAVRKLTLRADEALFHLAENTAKVSFNASCEPAPFDDDAGAWLPQNAKAFLSKVPAAREAIERALFGADQ